MVNQAQTMHQLVDEVDHLISLPTVCANVLNLSHSDHATSKDIEKELKKDPGIAAQVLRMANSAFYNLTAKVDTISRAVSIIGTRRITNIVLAVSTIKSMQVFKNEIVSLENFWSHSISCGVIAARLARYCGHKDNESFFVSGLLHDIGQIILFSKCSTQIKQALELMQVDSEYNDFYVYESQVLGFNHTDVGAAVALKWHLPSTIVESIAYHHEPTDSLKHPFDVAIVHIANMLANLAEIRSEDIDDAPPINPLTWKITNLTPEICIELLKESYQEYEETQAALLAA